MISLMIGNPLQKSLDDALLREKELKEEVPNLSDEAMSTSGIYFEHPNEQIIFLYPNLDFIPMDFLKVAHGGKLGDEEAMAPLELENSASLENSQGEGEMKEGV